MTPTCTSKGLCDNPMSNCDCSEAGKPGAAFVRREPGALLSAVRCLSPANAREMIEGHTFEPATAMSEPLLLYAYACDVNDGALTCGSVAAPAAPTGLPRSPWPLPPLSYCPFAPYACRLRPAHPSGSPARYREPI
jgi:hypothetical protein